MYVCTDTYWKENDVQCTKRALMQFCGQHRPRSACINHICTGWAGPSLSAYWINRYCIIYLWTQVPRSDCMDMHADLDLGCLYMTSEPFSHVVHQWCWFEYLSGPSCSKLTMSLVNDLLKFTWVILKYAEIICWKNVSSFCSKSYSHFFQQKISEYCILNPLKQLTKWPLTELVKLTTLWTTGTLEFCLRLNYSKGISTCKKKNKHA